MVNDHAIIIGSSQFTQERDCLDPLEPIKLMEKTSRDAIVDTKSDKILAYIDSVFVSRVVSHYYRDTPNILSAILKINPTRTLYSDFGGNNPQFFVNHAAKLIETGQAKLILITGAEAQYSKYRSQKGEIKLNWSEYKNFDSDSRQDADSQTNNNTLSFKYGMMLPMDVYSMFETSLRKNLGHDLKDHRYYMSRILKDFSEIASKNPYSWSKKFYNENDIAEPSDHNRYVCHPYLKLMMSNPFVDQSASIIMTSERFATKLGINKEKWVYLMGRADVDNIHDVIKRPFLYDSPAIREAFKLSLSQAGLKVEDIDFFDLYSCFPFMIEVAMNELNIFNKDLKKLTITGGMPFFGGPYNNYSLHAIVSAMNLIQNDNNLKIMILSNGGYNTKISLGIYGKAPPLKHWDSDEELRVQSDISQVSTPKIIEKASGILKVEGYTIKYDRAGKPTQGIVIGSLENGDRTIANIKANNNDLMDLEKQELVGKEYKVIHQKGYNRVIF